MISNGADSERNMERLRYGKREKKIVKDEEKPSKGGKTANSKKEGNKKNGRSDWIRTSDPLVPNQVRYQAAPRSDKVVK